MKVLATILSALMIASSVKQVLGSSKDSLSHKSNTAESNTSNTGPDSYEEKLKVWQNGGNIPTNNGDEIPCYKIPGNLSSPCHERAECVMWKHVTGLWYKCNCQDGYVGNGLKGMSGCRDINECELERPCHGLAECNNADGSFTCSCKNGYTGDGVLYCSDLDECAEYGSRALCSRHAQCSNLHGSFACHCLPGYVKSDDGTHCLPDACALGYWGSTCQQACHCANGMSCHRETGICDGTCQVGYHGDRCDVFGKDSCAEMNVICLHGGTCQDGEKVGEFRCLCREGYDGLICQEKSVYMLSELCEAGKWGRLCHFECHCHGKGPCHKLTGECIPCNVPECPVTLHGNKCEPGWRGASCNVFGNDSCTRSRCTNGGTCQDGVQEESYTCVCPPGYTGVYCGELVEDETLASCAVGWWGEQCMQPCYCRKLSEACDRDTGICPGGVDACQPGFHGPSCDIHGEDGCVSDKPLCHHGGTCLDQLDQPGAHNKYHCLCAEGYTGWNCEVDVDSSNDVLFQSPGHRGSKIEKLLDPELISISEKVMSVLDRNKILEKK